MEHSPEIRRALGISSAILFALGSLSLANHAETPETPDNVVVRAALPPTTVTVPETTTTAAPTTTLPERVAKERVSRGALRPRLATPPIQSLPPEFWFDLTFCEDGHQLVDSDPNDPFHSYFQWHISPKWNTWHAAGGTGMPEEHSYEEQLVIAKGWASATDPYKQWPVCWPRAMRLLQERQTG